MKNFFLSRKPKNIILIGFVLIFGWFILFNYLLTPFVDFLPNSVIAVLGEIIYPIGSTLWPLVVVFGFIIWPIKTILMRKERSFQKDSLNKGVSENKNYGKEN